MSKRYTGEEWSDDDYDGNSLSGSPPKRPKNSELNQREESSKSGFISRAINTVCSSFNYILKGFNSSPEVKRMNCESVRSQTSLGMNQNNAIFNVEMRSDQQLASNSQIYQMIPASSFYVINNPSPQPSGQVLTQIPVAIYTAANSSPNSLVFSLNSSAHDMNNPFKCQSCGQINTSPVIQCPHCRTQKSGRVNSCAITTQKFYSQTSPAVRRISSVSTGRARMQISNSSMIGATPVISNVRSLSGGLSVNNRSLTNQRIHQTNGESKPEVIELDEENKTCSNVTSQETNDDEIEIMEEDIKEEMIVAHECDINSDTNNCENKAITPNINSINRSVVINNNNNEVIAKEGYPNYVMFGTHRTDSKIVKFTEDGIKLENVSPNNKETKFKYHIMIPFVEIQEIFYSCEENLNLLFIKPTIESNNKIQESMFLGSNSPNGLKFDINSIHPREHHIIVVLRDKMSSTFLTYLSQLSKSKKQDIKCGQIDRSVAKNMLESAKSRPTISEPRVQHINSSNHSILQSTPKRSNPYAVPKRNLAKNSDSSDSSPSPLRPRISSRRSNPKPPTQTIIIDIIDDDDEGIIETKDESESEFSPTKEIFQYPENEKGAIHLVGTDIICLNKGEFLNDNIVNFYLRYFFNEKLDEEMRKRTHIFDTLFFMQLTEKVKRNTGSGREDPYTFEQRYEQKLKKWTKNVDIFSKDFLVFPIIKESHWFLSIVCYHSSVYTLSLKSDSNSPKVKSEVKEEEVEIPEESLIIDKKPCIIFMDSLGNGSFKKSLSAPIREFLAFEWKSKHKTELSFKTAKVMKDFSPLVPNQTNSSDCGLFVLEYVEQFLKCPDDLVRKLFESGKNALLGWFESKDVKPKRQEIRNLVLSKVSPERRERLETLIDDTKLSDTEDDEIGMEVMNTSVDSKISSQDSEEIL